VTRPEEMYNFTVGVAHTYFVGEQEWLVHNRNLCDFSAETKTIKGERITTSVHATVPPENRRGGTGTNGSSRAWVQNVIGLFSDDAGHIIGRQLGGPGGKRSENIFAQNVNINRGAYRAFENRVASYIDRTDETVQIYIEFEFPSPNSTRPSRVNYNVYDMNGDYLMAETFPNP